MIFKLSSKLRYHFQYPLLFRFKGAQRRSLRKLINRKRKIAASLFAFEKKTLTRLQKLMAGPLEVVLGTLLGDGSIGIYKGYANARFQMRHAIKQEHWFDWKAAKLAAFASSKAKHIQTPTPKCYGKTPMLHFQTKVSQELTTIRNIVSPKNSTIIRRVWLNFLTPISLMCWWLDDGTVMKQIRQGMFCCEGFPKKQQYILVNYLKQRWKVHARVVPLLITEKDRSGKVIRKYKAFRIKLGTTQLKKFLLIILPYIPCEDMLYKVCLKYVDQTLQQRWISVLKQALPQFSLAIDDFYR